MQTVIFCGGRGLRMGGEGSRLPKALVEVGGWPVIWHVMKHYAHYGFRDFILCLGYKGEEIRDFFTGYARRTADVRLDLHTGRASLLGGADLEDWRITFVDTGLDTETGGRLLRVARHVEGERFFATYADGVADVDLPALLSFHASRPAVATVTAIRPRSPFGVLDVEGGWVRGFHEKPVMEQLISGGFFVFERAAFDYLDGDDCILEQAPLRRLAVEGRLAAYRHDGFWDCVDTQKDVGRLDRLWRESQPWKVW